MTTESDPRVYFAAERTLLAWLRSGIAVIGLGFLVARFGVFLTMIRGQQETSAHIIASAIGIVFVLLGALMIAGAAWQHMKFIRTLPQQNLPQQYSTAFSLSIAALVAIAAVALSIYLATTTRRSPWRKAAAASMHRTDDLASGTIAVRGFSSLCNLSCAIQQCRVIHSPFRASLIPCSRVLN